ncbi:FAD/NAD(P)-binding protein [Kitasatospora viridis]|uniref:FAD-NAD(P)-binding protein n=1 Tax=Kitasatospora viridis TaxID=281105 RepID=A0A561UCS0_9ACTN|nr:FAD/NAD(P)-binding protein [Kitasatospora viridis]TWF97147.1 FAD-NAD(P)-binding protein [Kitasatospora viridis]
MTDHQSPYRVAVVGTGPRGLAVLERVAARLAGRRAGRAVELYAIDSAEPGCGRIWRPAQPEQLLMNSMAADVTMFSGPRDDGPARPGAGPSLFEWWAVQEPGNASAQPGSYPPRAVFGRYLRFVLDAIEDDLPAGARLHRVRDTVLRMDRPDPGSGWLLSLAGGRTLEADRVVLSTGHPELEPTAADREFAAFAATGRGLAYVRGDSAADMPLDDLAAGSTVGVIGLGLTFFDVVSLLTEGRGGRFVTGPDGASLRYLPSGREPRLVAGSRSGATLPPRPRDERPTGHSHRARIFTRERVERLRAHGRLDFARQVLPWLSAELTLVYYATEIRERTGPQAAGLFTERAVRAVHALAPTAGTGDAPERVVARQAAGFGCADPAPLDLRGLAKPFTGREFPDRADYQRAVTELLRRDIADAEQGNVRNPLKAAIEALRDVRGSIRAAVDFSGLTPRSHREDFLGSFAPIGHHLFAGPPIARARQLLALMDAGVLQLIGPEARFAADEGLGRFTAGSPRVAEPPVPMDALVDARIPAPDIRRDTSPLIRQLRREAVVTDHVNADGAERFETGGLTVTPSPFHPVDGPGRPVPSLYALGIPTEHVRWLTQVGSSRPGPWGEYLADADAIAGDLLAGATELLAAVEVGA